MSVLLLRLAGPMQSWGDDSRFSRRETRQEPTKSGVLGMLAAAQGRRRSDPVEDLANLRFGVRVDQPGVLMKDYQTSHVNGWHKPPKLSDRFYLHDAIFVAAVEGDHSLIDALAASLSEPAYPLFLGRRACPTTGKLVLDVADGALVEQLQKVPWQAATWHRKQQLTTVAIDLHTDADGGEAGEMVRDRPLSFSSARREYTWRKVTRSVIHVDNPEGMDDTRGDQLVDWFAALKGF